MPRPPPAPAGTYNPASELSTDVDFLNRSGAAFRSQVYGPAQQELQRLTQERNEAARALAGEVSKGVNTYGKQDSRVVVMPSSVMNGSYNNTRGIEKVPVDTRKAWEKGAAGVRQAYRRVEQQEGVVGGYKRDLDSMGELRQRLERLQAGAPSVQQGEGAAKFAVEVSVAASSAQALARSLKDPDSTASAAYSGMAGRLEGLVEQVKKRFGVSDQDMAKF